MCLENKWVSYAQHVIRHQANFSPQEQQEEEIKRGREEQRNANQIRREQMRKEAEQAHEQKSPQALRRPESKERPK